MIQYTVSIPQLPAFEAAFARAPEITTSALKTAVNKSLAAYQATAKQLAPVNTGYLRGSIQIHPASGTGVNVQGEVYTKTTYSGFQEAGTGMYGPTPHMIVPKSKPVLRFKTKDGRWVTTKQVRGVRPRYYFKGSVDQNQSRMEGFFDQALTEITETLTKT